MRARDFEQAKEFRNWTCWKGREITPASTTLGKSEVSNHISFSNLFIFVHAASISQTVGRANHRTLSSTRWQLIQVVYYCTCIAQLTEMTSRSVTGRNVVNNVNHIMSSALSNWVNSLYFFESQSWQNQDYNMRQAMVESHNWAVVLMFTIGHQEIPQNKPFACEELQIPCDGKQVVLPQRIAFAREKFDIYIFSTALVK